MEKNQIFTFTAPNGAEVTAVVIEKIGGGFYQGCDCSYDTFLCYAQNRVFTYAEEKYREKAIMHSCDLKQPVISVGYEFGRVLIDYCIIPEYDNLLEDYEHQLDMADDYASKEL